MAATLLTNPFDVLKTRTHLQGELKTRGNYVAHYKGPFQSIAIIIKKEGILALQKGLLPSVLNQGVRNGIKLGFYGWLSNSGYLCDAGNRTIFYNSLVASAFGGGVGAFLGTPLYTLTTQFQAKASPEIAVGYQHEHTSLVQALKTTYNTSGVTTTNGVALVFTELSSRFEVYGKGRTPMLLGRLWGLRHSLPLSLRRRKSFGNTKYFVIPEF